MLGIVTKMCAKMTGSRCAMPRLSNWSLRAPSTGRIGLDVADVLTGGATIAVPVNVRIYGAKFFSGLTGDVTTTEHGPMSTVMQGFGAGVGAGAGWGLPVVGKGKIDKSIPRGLKRWIATEAAAQGQGQIEKLARELLWDGISGGTRMIAGPDAGPVLSVSDFHQSWVTIFELGANFAVNGVSFGMVIVSKKGPVFSPSGVIHARAFGLMGGISLASSLDVEASGLAFRVGFS